MDSPVSQIKKLEENIKTAMRALPRKIGVDVIQFSKNSFRKQGWIGNVFHKWPGRKATGGKQGQKNRGRALLILTGRLRRSIKVLSIQGGTIRVGSNVPYARMHNYGYRGTVHVREHTRRRERSRSVTKAMGNSTVKAHTRKVNMPARRFLGDSPYLRKQIERTVAAEIMKAARNSRF